MYYFCTAISNRNSCLFLNGVFEAIYVTKTSWRSLRNSWSSESKSKASFDFAESRQESRKILQAKFCGNSSVGRARPCQGRGREFESRFPLTVLSNMNHSFHADFLEQWVQCQASLSIAESRQKADWRSQAEIAQLVEHDLAKVGVASSSLVFRSNK